MEKYVNDFIIKKKGELKLISRHNYSKNVQVYLQNFLLNTTF